MTNWHLHLCWFCTASRSYSSFVLVTRETSPTESDVVSWKGATVTTPASFWKVWLNASNSSFSFPWLWRLSIKHTHISSTLCLPRYFRPLILHDGYTNQQVCVRNSSNPACSPRECLLGLSFGRPYQYGEEGNEHGSTSRAHLGL